MDRSSGTIQPSMIMPDPRSVLATSSVDRLRSSASGGKSVGRFVSLRLRSGRAAAESLRVLGSRQRNHRRHAEPHPLPALGDRAMEKALGNGRSNQPADHGGAGGLAENRDVVRIAPERAQCCSAPTAARRWCPSSAWLPDAFRPDSLRQLGMREEPECSEPVIKGDQHHAFSGQRLSVVVRAGSGALRVCAAVNPEHHGQPRVRAFAADVQTFR